MLIVGLGNPGPTYEATRHNIGFRVVDRLVARLHGSRWKSEKDVAWAVLGEHWVIKPMAFMNRSGPALKTFLDYKQIKLGADDQAASLLVIHDELDFPFGEMKLQAGRSSAGHNGVQSIIDSWDGWQDFQRLRIGVGDNRDQGLPAEDYVLQNFSSAEAKQLPAVIDQAVSMLANSL